MPARRLTGPGRGRLLYPGTGPGPLRAAGSRSCTAPSAETPAPADSDYPGRVASVLALGAALMMGLGVTDAPVPDAPPAPTQPRTEYGAIPLVGGDTDYGIGAGYLASVAGFRPDVAPFAWRVESAGFISFKPTGAGDVAAGSWVNPYQDYYVLLQVPRFLHRRLYLALRPSFTRETTQHYYGLGNASV